ncbi:hypothetical protein AALB16_13445 [Lachnospiraceae bacterium 62-35]
MDKFMEVRLRLDEITYKNFAAEGEKTLPFSKMTEEEREYMGKEIRIAALKSLGYEITEEKSSK